MFYHIIASGSKGNATIVVSNKSVLLIDMGISLTRLTEGLQEINLTVKDITGALFTHNHADHISGLKFISPKIMYALEGTLPTSLSNVVNLNEPFTIGDFTITPVKTSHDAINPCGFFIKDKEESLFYMTDTGVFLEDNLPIVKNPTYLIIESNHDIKMLFINQPYAVYKDFIFFRIDLNITSSCYLTVYDKLAFKRKFFCFASCSNILTAEYLIKSFKCHKIIPFNICCNFTIFFSDNQ